jgi:hypothetical protein
LKIHKCKTKVNDRVRTMNTRAIAAEYRLAHWAGIMRERQESGLSIRAYCERSGFHENIYYYWQRKLREAACEKLAGQQPAANPETTALVPGGWAVCEINESCNSHPAEERESYKREPAKNTIYIELGKCRIVVTAETNHEMLAEVYRTLARVETSPGLIQC